MFIKIGYGLVEKVANLPASAILAFPVTAQFAVQTTFVLTTTDSHALHTSFTLTWSVLKCQLANAPPLMHRIRRKRYKKHP